MLIILTVTGMGLCGTHLTLAVENADSHQREMREYSPLQKNPEELVQQSDPGVQNQGDGESGFFTRTWENVIAPFFGTVVKIIKKTGINASAGV